MNEQISATPWMTPEKAAAYLGISLGTLRNWTSARYVPFARRGRVVRFHREKLDAWLRRGECHGRTEHADIKASTTQEENLRA